MPQQITIRFYEELNDFLTQDKRQTDFNVELKKARSVKDLIESIGVPHTEVDLIIVDGGSVDFSYLVQPDDHIIVYPASNTIPNGVEVKHASLLHCQPPPYLNPDLCLMFTWAGLPRTCVCWVSIRSIEMTMMIQR